MRAMQFWVWEYDCHTSYPLKKRYPYLHVTSGECTQHLGSIYQNENMTQFGCAKMWNDKYDMCDWNIIKKIHKWILQAIWRLLCVSFVDAPVVLPKQITGKTGK